MINLMNQGKQKLIALLQRLRKFKGKEIKDSRLMLEYAVIKDIVLEHTGEVAYEKYWMHRGKYIGEEELCKVIVQSFCAYDIEEFLRFVVGNQIGNAEETCRLLREVQLIPDDFAISENCGNTTATYEEAIHLVIAIRDTVLRYKASNKGAKYDDSKLIAALMANKHVDRLLCKLQKAINEGKTFDEISVFTDEIKKNYLQNLLFAINTVKLESYQVKWTRAMRSLDKALNKLSANTDDKLKRCKVCLQQNNKIDVARELRSIHPKVHALSRHNLLDFLLISNSANDIGLLNAYIHKTVTDAIGFTDKNAHVVFEGIPHPYIYRWCEDNAMYNVRASFALESRDICKIINTDEIIKANKMITVATPSNLRGRMLQEHSKASMLFLNMSDISVTNDTIYERLKPWIGYLRHGCIIYVLGGNSVSRDAERSIFNPRHHQLELQSIQLYPDKIDRVTYPRRKALIRMRFAKQGCSNHGVVAVCRYRIQDMNGYQLLYLSTHVDIPTQLAQCDGMTTRGIVNHFVRQPDNPNDKREKAEVFEYSDEICIHYSFSPGQIVAYLCAPLEDNYCGTRHYGKKIVETEKSKRGLSYNAALSWMKEDYLYENVRLKHAGVDVPLQHIPTIRLVVAKIFNKRYHGEAISLRTLVYINPDFENELAGDDVRLLYQLISSEVGNLLTDTKNKEEIMRCISCAFPHQKLQRTEEFTAIIHALLQLAVENGHAITNIFADSVDNTKQKKLRNRLQEIRDHLGIRSLPLVIYRRLFEHVLERAKQEPIYIGVILRLLYGTSATEICTLTWDDLKHPEDSSFSLLHICTVLKKGEIATIDANFRQNRTLPLLPVVYKLLADHKRSFVERNPLMTDQEISACSIFTLAPLTLAQAAAVHKQLSAKSRACINWLNLRDNVVTVYEGQDEVKIDLNAYRGDLFRSNLSHYLRNYAVCGEGEVASLFGNAPLITVNRHYIDFGNQDAQLRLYVQLCRLYALLTDDIGAGSLGTLCLDNKRRIHTLHTNSAHPSVVELDMVITDGGETEITVDTALGADTTVTQQQQTVNKHMEAGE